MYEAVIKKEKKNRARGSVVINGGPDIKNKISEFTSKENVEIAFECSGAEFLLNSSINVLKKSGKIVILSNQINNIIIYLLVVLNRI